MSEQTPSGKPPSRFWLFLPYGAVAAGVLAWSLVWILASHRIGDRLNARAGQLRAEGYRIETGKLQVDGFPFRLRVKSEGVKIVSPSGWAIRAPKLEGQAYLYGLDHWVLGAEQGFTLTRPVGGDVQVRGQSLRASLSAIGAPVWRMAFEGVGLTLTPTPGAAPFSLASADRLEIYTRPGMADLASAEGLIRLEGGRAAPNTVLHEKIGKHGLTGAMALRLTRFDRYGGKGWSQAGRNWAAAGGQLQIDPTAPPARDLQLSFGAARLSFGLDGRPQGKIVYAFSPANGPKGVEQGWEFGANSPRLF
jgi:hypothetical protein